MDAITPVACVVMARAPYIAPGTSFTSIVNSASPDASFCAAMLTMASDTGASLLSDV
jgi:hypothetical protein